MLRMIPLFLVTLGTLGCSNHVEATQPSPPPASSRAAAHRGTTVSFPSSPGNASGYLAVPAKGGPRHPALVVVQEWWGVNDWMKENSDRFARQGYVALAVDLYRGRVARDANEAHELMRGLPEDRVMADLHAAFNALAARPDVDPKRIGVIGWCMGGGYALMLTLDEPRLAASVINYGHLMSDPANLKKIGAPLLGNFGADDRGIAPADVETFTAQLRELKKPADVKIYPGAGHGFMNPNNRDGFNAQAADDAWKRIDAFLAARLQP